MNNVIFLVYEKIRCDFAHQHLFRLRADSYVLLNRHCNTHGIATLFQSIVGKTVYDLLRSGQKNRIIDRHACHTQGPHGSTVRRRYLSIRYALCDSHTPNFATPAVKIMFFAKNRQRYHNLNKKYTMYRIKRKVSPGIEPGSPGQSRHVLTRTRDQNRK